MYGDCAVLQILHSASGSVQDDKIGSVQDDKIGSVQDDKIGSVQDDKIGSVQDDRRGRSDVVVGGVFDTSDVLCSDR